MIDRLWVQVRRILSIIRFRVAMLLLRMLAGTKATPFVVFPHSPAGPGSGDWVPADPAAPPCVISQIDTTEWMEVVAPVSSRRIRSLSLRVPRPFEGSDWEDVHEGEEEFLGHILGTWHVLERGASGPPEVVRDVTFWIGPQEGYPTVGMPPGTKQLSYSECQAMLNGRHMRMALFTLSPPIGRERYYASAFWRVGSGAWVTALAGGPNREAQLEAATILQSVRIQQR